MKNKIVFGKWEAVGLLINMICTKIFLNFPRTMAEDAGTAGWILIAYVALVVFIWFFVISKLYYFFEGKDLLDISEYVGGNILKIIVGVVITIFLIYISAVYLREYSEDMKIISLTTSPISYVMLFFTVGMIIAAYIGLEAIVRTVSISQPIIVIGFLLILLGVLQYFDISKILPILGSGAYSIFGKGFFKISVFGELLILFIIAPFIKTHKNFKSAGFIGLGFSTLFLFLSVFIYLNVVQYPAAVESFLPIYQLARLINYGRFFQRIESIFMFIWAIAALFYLSVNLYFTVYIFGKTFKITYHKPLIFPFSVIIFSLSLLPQNLIASVKLDTKYFRSFAWIITFVLPTLILFIGVIKKKNKSKRVVENE